MISRDGEFATMIQQKEEDETQKLMEKEQQAILSTLTGKALLLIHRVLYLHYFFQSSIPQNLGVASKVTTLATDSMFFFSDLLLRLQAVYRVSRKKSTVDVGYLWYLGCILYHLLFGSPLCNVDGQQINILLSDFIYHCLHFLKIFMILLLAFLALMLLILAF